MTNFAGKIFVHGDDGIEVVGKVDKNKVHFDSDRILESLLEASENFSEEPFKMAVIKC